jgi:hypothetical protein
MELRESIEKTIEVDGDSNLKMKVRCCFYIYSARGRAGEIAKFPSFVAVETS